MIQPRIRPTNDLSNQAKLKFKLLLTDLFFSRGSYSRVANVCMFILISQISMRYQFYDFRSLISQVSQIFELSGLSSMRTLVTAGYNSVQIIQPSTRCCHFSMFSSVSNILIFSGFKIHHFYKVIV